MDDSMWIVPFSALQIVVLKLEYYTFGTPKLLCMLFNNSPHFSAMLNIYIYICV